MAIQIRVSDDIYQEKLITLNRQKMFITISYNDRDSRWYFDISDSLGNDVITGVKILPDQDLTDKYLEVSSFIGGSLTCLDVKANGQEITRDNFGTDKHYQLWYISDKDKEDYVNGTSV